MIVGILLLVLGNVLIWNSDEETTQIYSGWLFGIFMFGVSGGLKSQVRYVVAFVGLFFILYFPQTVTTKRKVLECVHGEERVINGEYKCICDPPWNGELCNRCPDSVLNNDVENGICNTCKHMYKYPFCTELAPGYEREDLCKNNFVTSCLGLPLNDDVVKSYENVDGVRNLLYDSVNCNGLPPYSTYCVKCKEGRTGEFCCEDGKWGRDCNQDVPKCTDDGDKDAKLRPNFIPEYFPIDPEVCYDEACSCGGEFVGDHLCASNLCHSEGKCYSISATPTRESRCICDVGAGPDCSTAPCYGGTRSWYGGINGKFKCSCSSSYNSASDDCDITYSGSCYPSLYSDGGGGCEECQCALKSDTYGQCDKTKYDVFPRSFKRPFKLEGCVETGICTHNSSDCGDTTYLDGMPVYGRCLYDMDVEDQETAYFSGHKCSNVKVSPWYLPSQ